jgi:hypothetical protein
MNYCESSLPVVVDKTEEIACDDDRDLVRFCHTLQLEDTDTTTKSVCVWLWVWL